MNNASVIHKLRPLQTTLCGPVIGGETLCKDRGTPGDPVTASFNNHEVTCVRCINLIKGRG